MGKARKSGTATAQTGQSQCPATYFRRVNPLLMAVIGITNAYHAWILFAPETVPTRYLGRLGTLTEYLVEHCRIYLIVWFCIVWLLHFLYTLYALRLCRDKGITDFATRCRWTVQTIFFGLSSLFLLLIYKPPMKKHQ